MRSTFPLLLTTATLTHAWAGNFNTDELVAYDFETSGGLGPFLACSVKQPSGSWQSSDNPYKGNGRLDVFFDETGYDGTREDRGSEICTDNPIGFGKDGWLGFALNVPSELYPDDQDTIIAQLFCSGGCSSWCGVLHIDNNALAVEYRGDCSPNAPYAVILEIPRDEWHSVVMHMKTSSTNDGVMEVFFNGAKVFSDTGINLGFGDSWDAKDHVIPRVTYKNGMYAADTSGYTNRTRDLYFDNISWFNGDDSDKDGFDVVSP